MYGARLGTLYSGVFDYLIAHFNEPLEQTLQEAQMPAGGLPSKPPGTLFRTTRDGNGVGYPLVATAAFRVFGTHTWALTLTMLLLMATSAAIFLLRFSRAAYAGIVILYFTALTVMLFTSLLWDPTYNVQTPVGGIRYCSLVSVLPIFHILLELIETKSTAAVSRKRLDLLLGLQSAILVLVVLVRGSTLPLTAAIVLVIGVLGLALVSGARHFARAGPQSRSDWRREQRHVGGDRTVDTTRISDSRTLRNGHLGPCGGKPGRKSRVPVPWEMLIARNMSPEE